MTIIQEGAAAELEFNPRGQVPSFDKNRPGKLAEFASIHVGDCCVEDLIAVAFDFMGDNEFDEVDGLIGSDFLRFYKVGIDYPARTVTLSLDTTTLAMPGNGILLPIETPLPIRAPFVDCTLNGAITGKAMIDLGSPWTLVLPLSYIEKLKNTGDLELIEAVGIVAKWPMSKTDRSCLARLQSLKIGTMTVENLPVVFADVEDILLGKQFLDHFRFTIDYPDKMVSFQPLEGMAFKDNLYSTGLYLKKNDDNRAVVKGFWKNSPSEKAGLKVGNEILRINDLMAEDHAVWELLLPLNNDNLSAVEVLVNQQGHSVLKTLHKEWLLPASKR